MSGNLRTNLVVLIALASLTAFLALVAWPQPPTVSGAGIASVQSGTGYTCSTTEAGGGRCWGDNSFGQLGDGTTDDSTTPVTVQLAAGTVQQIDGGGFHACARTSASNVACWGRNDSGQLGNGTTNDNGNPAFVASLNGTVATVAAGTKHTCVLTTSGGVRCWGRNDFGQIGQNTLETCQVGTPCSTSPVDVTNLASGVESIATGGFQSCAVNGAGGVKCWGRNTFGQLGNGQTTSTTVPQDVLGLTSGVQAISAGSRHTCALLDGGTVKCWGSNAFGQLGDGQACVSIACSTPVTVQGLPNVAAISVGNFHTCALTSAGAVVCWGRNDFGQLGNGTTNDSSTFVNATTLGSGVVALDAGGFHGCAQLQEGSVRCWGDNTVGQLGAPTSEVCTVFMVLLPCSRSPVKAVVLQKATPKNPDGDTDGDTILNSVDPNDDNDACSDAQENGPDETLGGQRDPHNFWDFFDPNLDGSVSVADFLALLQRFGAAGDAGIDPFSTPAAPPAYHTRFDRGAVVGNHPWNVGGPNGAITVTDFFSLLAQFGHVCT